jgi:transcriptional antiterminator RfaH
MAFTVHLNAKYMVNFKEGWYLIYTKPNQERRVSEQLADKKIRTYFPLFKTKKKWSDRIKIVYERIFPSYVFVYLTDLGDFYEGTRADGACYYVKHGKLPACMSEQDIEYVRMIENNGENLEVVEKAFQVGQRLIINEGPLNGLSCEVIKYRGKTRIIVRVGFLQRCLLADLPFSALVECNNC